MKKLVTIIMAGVLMISLAACGELRSQQRRLQTLQRLRQKILQ